MAVSPAAARGSRPNDVTRYVETLGSPYEFRYKSGEAIYARNIWDMCAFHGKLYLGAGNSSNEGPASNAGPVSIYSYDPAKRRFAQEFSVDDEQVDVFRCFGDQLYIPGHDPRESWELGNFYRLERDGKWRKYRNIPDSIHNYDMAYHNGVLFAGLGSAKGSIAASGDLGRTWKVAGPQGWRVFSFINVDKHVYAMGQFVSREDATEAAEQKIDLPVACWEYVPGSGFAPRADLSAERLFPAAVIPQRAQAKVVRPVSLRGKTVFIGALCHNDHQSLPLGIFVARSLREGAIDVRRANIPTQARAWDLLMYKGVVFALLDLPDGDGTTVLVLASSDLTDWTEVMRFRSKTFARSFAILGRDFYFGLGCEVADPAHWKPEELEPETGTILRVSGKRFVLPREPS